MWCITPCTPNTPQYTMWCITPCTPRYTTYTMVHHVVYYTMVHHTHHGTPSGVLHLIHHSTQCTPWYTHTPWHTTWCITCTPHGVHFSQISLQSHVTTHLSQSEGSILSNLSDLVRNCEISPIIFPPFKEQSCYNSSAKTCHESQR